MTGTFRQLAYRSFFTFFSESRMRRRWPSFSFPGQSQILPALFSVPSSVSKVAVRAFSRRFSPGRCDDCVGTDVYLLALALPPVTQLFCSLGYLFARSQSAFSCKATYICGARVGAEMFPRGLWSLDSLAASLVSLSAPPASWPGSGSRWSSFRRLRGAASLLGPLLHRRTRGRPPSVRSPTRAQGANCWTAAANSWNDSPIRWDPGLQLRPAGRCQLVVAGTNFHSPNDVLMCRSGWDPVGRQQLVSAI
jgi:hypothetical protein